MLKNDARVWKLSLRDGAVEVHLPDSTSLDAVTRQLPQGFYSTFRTFDGGKRVLGLRSHLKRLYQPGGKEIVKPDVNANILCQDLADILLEYPDEARVRVIVTMKGDVYIALTPLVSLPREIYQQGVKVITTNARRESPRMKSTAFISSSESIRNKIASSDIFEALLVHNGSILEGMTSNFFYVRNGNLGTARKSILLGVTRRMVLHVARGSGIGIVYGALRWEQVSGLDEAFLTSSSRGIVPIIQIDSTPVGEGSPGLYTKRLSIKYDSYVLRHAKSIRNVASQI
jgi:branched-chain amino acid aminotransferase